MNTAWKVMGYVKLALPTPNSFPGGLLYARISEKGCHCERSEAISSEPLDVLVTRLLRRFAPRNDTMCA